MALFDSKAKFHALSPKHGAFSLSTAVSWNYLFPKAGQNTCFPLVLGNGQNSVAETFQRTSALGRHLAWKNVSPSNYSLAKL